MNANICGPCGDGDLASMRRDSLNSNNIEEEVIFIDDDRGTASTPRIITDADIFLIEQIQSPDIPYIDDDFTDSCDTTSVDDPIKSVLESIINQICDIDVGVVFDETNITRKSELPSSQGVSDYPIVDLELEEPLTISHDDQLNVKEKIMNVDVPILVSNIGVINELKQSTVVAPDETEEIVDSHAIANRLKETLQENNRLSVLLNNAELEINRATETANTNDREKTERIAMLEIDLEYLSGRVNEFTTCKETYENELSSIRLELQQEKEANVNLRHNLKEEMRQRILELKAVTESEKQSLVKQVAALKEKETDYLRKVDELRTNNDELTHQIRDFKADVKSKIMEVDAYRVVAEKLKSVVVKLEEDNAILKRKTHTTVSSINEEPEIITIDTDDPESNEDDDDNYLKNIQKSNDSFVSTKRVQSSKIVDSVSKRQRLSRELSTDVVMVASNSHEKLNDPTSSATAKNLSEDVNDRVRQDIGINVSLPSNETKLGSLFSELADATNRLEPDLLSLSLHVCQEKNKVDSLECQLRQRASIEEKVLIDQQERFADLERRLNETQIELDEHKKSVRRLEVEKATIQQKNEELDVAVVAKDNDNEVLRQELEKLKEIEQKYDGIKDTVQAILVERDILQERVFVLESGQEGLQELKRKIVMLEADLSVANAEKERLNGLTLELNRSTHSIATLEESVANLKAEADEAATERNELVTELANRQREIDRIMEACKQTIVMADEERKNMLQKCQESVEVSERTADVLRVEISEISNCNLELKEQLVVFRSKLDETEIQLNSKIETINSLNADVEVFCSQRDSNKANMDSLSAEFAMTKKKLSETEKELENALRAAKQFEIRIKEQSARATKLETIKEKFQSIESELYLILVDRNDVHEKLKELKDTFMNDDDPELTLSTLRSEFQAVRSNYDDPKCCLKQLETDVLNNVYNLAEFEKSKLKAANERERLCSEISRLREELRATSSARVDLQEELQFLKENNSALITKMEKMEGLLKRVERLNSMETELNRGISKLEGDIVDNCQDDQAVKDLGSDLNEAQNKLSKMTATVAEIGSIVPTIESAPFKLIEEMLAKINELQSNNEALQNRLKLALANGRRMETLLQTLQQTSPVSKVKLGISRQLEAVQIERDDLLKKVSETDNLNKRLKIKVISLVKAIKKLQGKTNETSNVCTMSLDDWEGLGNESNEVGKSVKDADDGNGHNERGQQVLAKSLQVGGGRTAFNTKENESGNRKRLLAKGQFQSSECKKVCSVDVITACSIENPEGSVTNVKKIDLKLVPGSTTKTALNTITNGTPRSSIIVQKDGVQAKYVQLPVQGSVGVPQASDDCKVQ